MSQEEDNVPDLITVESGQTVASDVEEEQAGTGVPGMPFDPEKIDVKTKPLTLDSLVKRLMHKEIDLSPDFQRRANLWTDIKKSRLIESILLRIPLPVFYFADQGNDAWLVIDGLQRLSSIRQFVLDKEEPLRLTGLEYLTDLENKTWDQLPRNYVRRFEEHEITIHIIQPVVDKTVMTSIFRRINTGGLPLSDQEIRHALFQGKGTDWLAKLSSDKTFLDSTERKINDSRMEARECILRFYAFYSFGPDRYSLTKESTSYYSLGTFLDRAMERLNAASDSDLENWEQIFVNASDAARRVLGRYAFRKVYRTESGLRRGPINKALYEAWMVALADLNSEEINVLTQKKDDLLALFEKALHPDDSHESSDISTSKNLDLMLAVSANTGDTARVHFRHRTIKSLIQKCLTS